MTNNFKPGDLALTLVDRCGIPALSQVEIVELVEAGTVLKIVDGGSGIFSVDTLRCSVASIPHADLMFRHKELMPLRGDFAPEQTKSREVSV